MQLGSSDETLVDTSATHSSVTSIIQTFSAATYVMGYLTSTAERMLRSPSSHKRRMSKLPETPTPSRGSFPLPLSDYSSSSSGDSFASSTVFWTPPQYRSRWSPKRLVPAVARSVITTRQLAVLLCLVLAFLVWIVPPPGTWRRRIVHVDLSQPLARPYRILQALAPASRMAVPDPTAWLTTNSDNKYALGTGPRVLEPLLNHGLISSRPRAALISLVRNTELPGIVQSMTQLEYRWNRKYQYPWIFFSDEPFSDEFKVSIRPFFAYRILIVAAARDPKPHIRSLLLRSHT